MIEPIATSNHALELGVNLGTAEMYGNDHNEEFINSHE